jgi:hypothetical protein
VTEHLDERDLVVPRANHVGDLADAVDIWPGRGPGRHDDDPVGTGERASVRFQAERARDDDESGAGLLAPLQPRGDDVVGSLHRTVVLLAHRAGADDDGVGEPAQVVEQRPVRLGRQGPGSPVRAGHRTVQRADHVGPQPPASAGQGGVGVLGEDRLNGSRVVGGSREQ